MFQTPAAPVQKSQAVRTIYSISFHYTEIYTSVLSFAPKMSCFNLTFDNEIFIDFCFYLFPASVSNQMTAPGMIRLVLDILFNLCISV